MNKIEKQREHFNSIAEVYKQGREEENHILIKKLIWNGIFSKIRMYTPTKEYSMLEAMCGYAEGYDIVSKNLGTTPTDYCGFDYSDDIVNSLSNSFPLLNVVHADAVNYIPKEEYYDIIVLIGGLHHVPDYADVVVKQLSKGLKKGGIFLNFEPTHANPLYKYIRERIYKKNNIFDEDTERAFHIEELINFFENANLKPISIQHVGLSAYTLYYNPYAFPILNKGSKKFVNFFYNLDSYFMDNKIGKFFSFATLSAWIKE